MTLQPNPDAPPSLKKIVRELMALLGEKGDIAEMQLRRIVVHSGREFAMEMHRRAVEVEAAGGLTFEARSGATLRRTLGGVFFWLVKEALGPEEALKLLPSTRDLHRRKLAARAAREAAEPKTPGAEKPLPVVEAVPVTKAIPVAVKPPPAAPKPQPAPKAPPAQKASPKAPPKGGFSGKKRGPVKMPEVFHSVRTK